jgi:hypothetical protein
MLDAGSKHNTGTETNNDESCSTGAPSILPDQDLERRSKPTVTCALGCIHPSNDAAKLTTPLSQRIQRAAPKRPSVPQEIERLQEGGFARSIKTEKVVRVARRFHINNRQVSDAFNPYASKPKRLPFGHSQRRMGITTCLTRLWSTSRNNTLEPASRSISNTSSPESAPSASNT